MDYTKLIKDFDANNPLLAFFQKGIKPEHIKEAILRSLIPYFKNKERLKSIAMNQLVAGWINFELFKRNQWYFDKFEKCLDLFNQTLKINSNSCINAVVDWLPEISQCVTRYWSFKNLEVDKNKLELNEFLEENLKNIGQFLEGIIKTYLKLLLHVNRIKQNKQVILSNIQSMDLGRIVNELINTTNFPDLFKPEPWNIRLNQWRNIAYHHLAKVENDRIKCWFKKESKTFSFYLERNELFEVTKSILNVYNTFKNVDFIFVFDNLDLIQNNVKNRSVFYSIRDESVLIELYSIINAQGFKIIDLNVNKKEAKLVIQELLDDQDINKRTIHSHQFLYSLWLYSNSEEVIIEYRLKEGTPHFESRTKKEVCEKIQIGEEKFEYLANKFEFKFLSDLKS